METYKNRGSVLLWLTEWIISFHIPTPTYISPDQVRNSYQLCNNGTLRVMYANGMGVSFHSEPHVLAGTITPTIGRCNISLPMENGLNSIEWRLRKEQIKGKVTIFGRKLRVSDSTLSPRSSRGYTPFAQELSKFPRSQASITPFFPGKDKVFPSEDRSPVPLGKPLHCLGENKVGIYLML